MDAFASTDMDALMAPVERFCRDELPALARQCGGAIDIQETNIAPALDGRRFNQRA